MSKSLLLPIVLLEIGLALAAQSPAQLYPLEEIHSGVQPGYDDYQHLRGINYLAAYTELYDGDGPQALSSPIVPGPQVHQFHPDPTVNFTGIGSSTTMWYFYDWPTDASATRAASDQLADQLLWIKRSGFNSVRVFLSFPLWQYYRNTTDGIDTLTPPRLGSNNLAIQRLEDFLDKCWYHGLRVMPVFWDDVIAGDGGSPATIATTGTDFHLNLSQDNFTGWHSSPGIAPTFDNFPVVVSAQGVLTAEGLAYVEEVMATFDAADYRRELLVAWDAMNEPQVWAESLVLATFDAIANYQEAGNGNVPLRRSKLFSYFVSDRPGRKYLLTMAKDPRCDVIGLHPYGQTALTYSSAIYDATTPAFTPPKPLIFTEVGSPGFAVSYQDTLDYSTLVKRPDLDAITGAAAGTHRGAGFMPWAFAVPTNAADDKAPFKTVSGIFYGQRDPATGYPIVRERSVVSSYVGLAQSQSQLHNVAPFWLWSGTEIQNDLVEDLQVPALMVRTDVDRSLDEYNGQLAALQIVKTPALAANLTWQECIDYSRMMMRITQFFDIEPAASTGNGNVFTNPGGFPYQLDPNDHALFYDEFKGMAHSSPIYQPGFPVNTSRTTPGGSFYYAYWVFQTYNGYPADLETPTTPEGTMYRIKLSDWALRLYDYMVARGGPGAR
ncbi:MAG: hypothetical protein KDE27_06800 [Planctomycetes bacterium]|nr:hypothetical protein [Planctomycetota bacterium]